MCPKRGEGSSPLHKGLKSPPPENIIPSIESRILIIVSGSSVGGIMTGAPPASSLVGNKGYEQARRFPSTSPVIPMIGRFVLSGYLL